MKSLNNSFNGIILPLITPFLNNKVDFISVEKLCDYYIKQNVNNLIIGGTTAEATSLTKDEKEQITNFIINKYKAKVKVIAGISALSTLDAINQAKKLQDLGVDGLLITAPAYIKPSQAGIYQHFQAIHDAVLLPILLYNIPYRTGINMEFNTIKKLAELKNIIGIKECGGEINQLIDIIHNTKLTIFTGEDHLLLSALALGAHGAISASAHICLSQMQMIVKEVSLGNLFQAQLIFKQILPIIRLCFVEPNPSVIKLILKHRGLIQSAEVRLPLIHASETLINQYLKLSETI